MPPGTKEDSIEYQIILELKHWFTILSENLIPDIKKMPGGVPQEFMDWMQ